jgi:transcriptional regulator with XRE-family HTH domain
MSELLATERETLSERVARRLRGAIAENRIVQRDLAAAAGIGQPQMSRRITGFTPFTLDELDRVAEALGIALDALLGTGAFEGVPIGRCAIRDSNPEPAD